MFMSSNFEGVLGGTSCNAFVGNAAATTVISSTVSLNELCVHCCLELAQSDSKVSTLIPFLMICPAALVLLQNSKSPSVPSTSSKSIPGRKRYADTSGSAVTPHPAAEDAPRHRVSASPG